MNLLEAKNLDVYKALLRTFSDFTDQCPGTGMGNVYRQLLELGLKCVPKDKKALAILEHVLSAKSTTARVQALSNTSFGSLPIVVRPVYKDKNRKVTAFYSKNDKIYSNVVDLLSFEGGTGSWTDEKGTKVTLLDLT